MRTEYIIVNTQGDNDIIDLTKKLEGIVREAGVKDAVLFLNVIGSTAGLTTMEYESGLEADLKHTLDRVLPFKKDYAHNATWSDDNGHAHLRSSFIKTNFFVPVTDGKLELGTWQQVVLIDFDTQPRERKIVVKIVV